MLVLARREKEKLVFPNIGVTVEILKISGRNVRVGIDAPPEVRVFRDEVTGVSDPVDVDLLAAKSPGISNHRLRNRLNKLQLGLHLLRRQSEQGLQAEGEETLQKVLAELRTLDGELVQRERPRSGKDIRRTLVVEDDKNEGELLAGLLRMNGFHVDVANDGCDALDQLATRGRPQIVLLDMHMPRCDGPETLSAIRRHPDYRSLSVFGVSGRTAAEMGIPVGPGGVDRWFTKPVNPEVLIRAMNRHLETACASA
jgi:carbon storage regulator CsrA